MPRPSAEPLAVVILGNDCVVAARPATPAQLVNACRAAGFDIVVPPSHGDELTADAYLAALTGLGDRVVVACSCPRVAAELEDSSPSIGCGRANVAPPPVAAARHLRALHSERLLITYAGDCPAGADASIDVHFAPAALFAALAREGIALDRQPSEFPAGDADRWRRHLSVPGGLPALRYLARPPVSRVVREVDVDSLARGVLPTSRAEMLLDLTESAHCACGGDRERIEEGEPLRSAVPIVAGPPSRADFGAAAALPAAAPVTAPPAAAEPMLAAREPDEKPSDERRAELVPDAAEPNAAVPEPARATALVQAPGPAAQRDPSRVTLAVLPPLVLVAVAALGLGVYASGAGGVGRRARAEPTEASRGARDDSGGLLPPRGSGSAALDASTAAANLATPAARPDTPSTPIPVAGSAASSIAGSVGDSRRAAATDSASADSVAAARRTRRARRPQVVPGWMPQGRSAWTPVDTSARPRPDSVPNVPPAAPHSDRPEEDAGSPPA